MSYEYQMERVKAKSTHSTGRKNTSKKISMIAQRNMRSNCNSCIQMLKFMDRPYFAEEGSPTYSWATKDKEMIESAKTTAISHLEAAQAGLASLPENSFKRIMEPAIKNVKEILGDQNLEIYPLTGDSYGMAQRGSRQISINIVRLRNNLNTLAKTLIHESFHIIGGCTSEDYDIICDGNLSKGKAYEEISKVSDISVMPADYFAQYIMKC